MLSCHPMLWVSVLSTLIFVLWSANCKLKSISELRAKYKVQSTKIKTNHHENNQTS